MKPLKPRYKHDCTRCVFLGTASYAAPQSGRHTVDVYFCQHGMMTEIVARFSSDSPDYASMDIESLEQRYARKIEAISTFGPALMFGYALWKLRKYGKG